MCNADTCNLETGRCVMNVCMIPDSADATFDTTFGNALDLLDRPCEPACLDFQTCSSGYCVQMTDPCSNQCLDGERCMSKEGQYVCIASSDCTACSDTEYCSYGECLTWPGDVPTKWQDDIQNTDLNSTRITSSLTFGSDVGEPIPVDKRVDIPSGEMVQFEDTRTDLDQIFFKCVENADCSETLASLIVDDDKELNVYRFDTNLEDVAVLLGANTRMRSNVTHFAEGTKTSFVLNVGAEVSLRNVHLDGEATISGNGYALVVMNTTTDTGVPGKITFNGGICVKGDCDQSTIDISVTGSYPATMQIRADDELRSSGNWIGTGDVDVVGSLVLSGPSVTPRLRIGAGGKVRVESPIFVGRDISIEGSLEIVDNYGQTEFEAISSCPEGAAIVFEVEDFTSLVDSSAIIKIMGYPDGMDTSAFRCDVIVRDETTGADINVPMDNSPSEPVLLKNFVVQPLQPRQLLSTSGGACVYGEWGADSLTFGAGECSVIDAAISVIPTSTILALCALMLA